MLIQIDALVDRMTVFYDALLCDLDYRSRRLKRKTRVRTILGLLEIAQLARRVKGKDGRRVWTATAKLVRMVGVLGPDAQRHPAKTRRPKFACAGVVPKEERKDYRYFDDHLYWAFELQHERCIEWIGWDLALVKLGRSSSKLAPGLLKITRLFALRLAVQEAARQLESQFDFDELIGDELPQRRPAAASRTVTSSSPTGQTSCALLQKGPEKDVVRLNGASPEKEG